MQIARFFCIERVPATLAGLGSVTVVALCAAFLSPVYFTNDDVALSDLLSGVTTGSPEPRVFLISPVLSYLLAWGYELVPSAPIYGLFLYGLHIVWIFTALWMAATSRGSLAQVTTLCLVMPLALSNLLLRLSFTSTAVAGGAVGALCLLSGIARGDRTRMVVSLPLLITSMLLRPDAFPLQACWIVPLWMAARESKRGKALIASAAAIVAAWGASRIVGEVVYSGSAWDQFATYQDARTKLQDTPRFNYWNYDTVAQAGIPWSRNDIELFKSCFNGDPAFADTGLLLKMIHISDAEVFDTMGALRRAHSAGVVNRFAMLMCACAWIVCWASMSRRAARKGVVLLALLLGGLVLLAVFRKVPQRIATPVLFGVSLFPVMAERGCAQGGGLWWRKIPYFLLQTVALAAMAYMSFVGTWSNAVRNVADSEEWALAASRISSVAVDPMVLASGLSSAWHYECCHPLTNGLRAHNITVVPLGWPWWLPPVQRAMTAQGMVDVGRAFSERPEMLLIGTEDTRRMWEVYLRRRLDRDVSVTRACAVDEIGEVQVFRVGR